MPDSKTIFVTGATGNQGKAIIKSLLAKGFRVKALTRNSSSPAAQYLKISGAEIVQGNLNDTSSYGNHLNGVDGVFCVLTYENGIDNEIKQGMNLVDLAKNYGLKYFLYSSVIGADLHTGVPHWESKSIIEDYIKKSGLHYSIIRPVSLYENFLIPQVKSRIHKGKLPSPVNKDVIQQFISSVDIGEISASMFLNPDKYAGKTITLAAEEMTMQEVANVFSEVLGKKIEYQKLPMFITWLFMGKRLYKMFKWINNNNAVFVKDIQGFRKEYPEMTSLREWIKINFTTG